MTILIPIFGWGLAIGLILFLVGTVGSGLELTVALLRRDADALDRVLVGRRIALWGLALAATACTALLVLFLVLRFAP